MFDQHGKTVILDLGEEILNDSGVFDFTDMTPRAKVKAFVKGMLDNGHDLVNMRNAQETRAHVAEFEAEIWQAMNALQFVATSIQIEKQIPILRVVK